MIIENLKLYAIIGGLGILILLILFLWLKDHGKQKAKRKSAELDKAAAEAKEKKAKENIEAVLTYEKQDALLVKQREEHVSTLVSTRSKEKVENEVKTLFDNMRDAYNSLPVE